MDIKFYADVLNRIKAESDKRMEIYKHGVDLINYENEYSTLVIDLILKHLPFMKKDDLEWWLYEDVEKIYYFPDDLNIDLSKAVDFLEYHYTEWRNNNRTKVIDDTIFIDYYLNVLDALEIMTDEWVDGGNCCPETTINMRDILKKLLIGDNDGTGN